MKLSIKKIILLSVSALIIIALSVLCYLLINHPTLFDPSLKQDEVVYIDVNNFFYTPEYADSVKDMEGYDEYRELDTLIHYTNGALTLAIQNSNRDSFSDDVLFFEDYFEAIINGDCEGFNDCYSEQWLSTHEAKEPFTPQMVYDMNIEKLSETTSDDVKTCAYNVMYKIFRNNGTFRDDIYSNASRTLYVEITDESGEFKITTQQYYVPVE